MTIQKKVIRFSVGQAASLSDWFAFNYFGIRESAVPVTGAPAEKVVGYSPFLAVPAIEQFGQINEVHHGPSPFLGRQGKNILVVRW